MARFRFAFISASSVALVLLSAAPRATAVQEPALTEWFQSMQGLSMSRSDAAALASKEAKTLSACGVTVPMLQALKDTMSSFSAMHMSMSEVRDNLLPLAYQHASPEHLAALYNTLSGFSDLGLPATEARAGTMKLASKHAEPYLLGPLFKTLSSWSSIGVPRSQAQQMAMDLTLAGADAEKLLESFNAAKSRMSRDAALEVAVSDAVDANLAGLVQRYAKDGKAYTAKEFQIHYGNKWQTEWQAAPQQKRTANDGKDYLASDFLEFFSTYWTSKWSAAPVAELRRIAKDGKTYTMGEFFQHYGDNWQEEWFKSYEMLDVCAGLNHAACDAQAVKCQWKWTGDWTDSCIVKPLGAQADLVV